MAWEDCGCSEFYFLSIAVKMNEMDLSTFDKLLLETVFQSEQESQNLKITKELIKCCTEKSLQEKQQIIELQKDICLCDETILELQKYNTENSESVRCLSFCNVLNREEAFLQSQLESAKSETENDKEKYQDSVSRYKEVLKQYQEQYMESTLAKNYHSIKQDLDSIQNVILKLDEQWITKEKSVVNALEPVPFESYNKWGLKLANLKKNTNETLEHTAEMSQSTLELTAKVKELEQKLEYINEHIENIARQENNPEAKIPDQTAKPQHISSGEVFCLQSSPGVCSDNLRVFPVKIFSEGRTDLTQSNEKHLQLLHLPDFPRHGQPSTEIQLATQPNESAGGVEKESSNILSQDESMEDNNQEPIINDENEKSKFPAGRLHHRPLRLILPQKQIPQKIGIRETENRKEQMATITEASKDSGYCSQVPSFAVPEIPSPATAASVKKVHFNNGKKRQNFIKSSKESFTGSMEQNEQSPYFNLFKTSTPKTPNFGTFESPSPFKSIKFPDQGGSYSSVDMSTSSPVKDFESIFGGMEGEDNFAFSFTSKPLQTSDEDRDNFGFKLPFGQDMRPSKDFSMKESGESQSKMKFTFF
uniref:Protein SIX6OS1 n=1 Tax=Pyxicephalus adspersus TaxID=30357 RepID=A0AAV2ZRG0_PYXAD|nr:TPA: hypothetical protein GDO54_005370 [Pyxicephalus adspersus]